MTTESELRADAFVGFVSVGSLQKDRSQLPTGPGVYAVLYSTAPAKPAFRVVGTGGHHKGKNPNVSVAALDGRWVEDAAIVYYGKAGAASKGRGLRKRVGEFLDFGAGKPVGHWGGRHTWQLPGTADLLVCWKETADDDARDIEKALINDFEQRFGKRPFANING